MSRQVGEFMLLLYVRNESHSVLSTERRRERGNERRAGGGGRGGGRRNKLPAFVQVCHVMSHQQLKYLSPSHVGTCIYATFLHN